MGGLRAGARHDATMQRRRPEAGVPKTSSAGDRSAGVMGVAKTPQRAYATGAYGTRAVLEILMCGEYHKVRG